MQATAKPVLFNILPHLASQANIQPVKLAPLPIEQRAYGAVVSGVIVVAGCHGFRDGDHFQGLIARKVSTNPMVVTNWRGLSFFGVVSVLKNGYMRVATPSGFCVFRPEYFDLIEVTHRRTPKQKKLRPVPDITARVL